MALKFLNKKGWHTGSLRNIENVWKAEQKHEAEEKKLEELRKQIHEEKERQEFRLLQEQAGLIPKQERLEFLYESGLAVGKSSDADGFKNLETLPSTSTVVDASSSGPSSSKEASAPGALFEDKPHSANDAWRKLHSDPLLMIRQREQEALARVKNNPVQMAMIRKTVESEKNKKKHEKERRKKHRHSKPKHHKDFSSEGDSDSEDDGPEKRRKKSDYDRNVNRDERSYSQDGRSKKEFKNEKDHHGGLKYSGHADYDQSDRKTSRTDTSSDKRHYDKSKRDRDTFEGRTNTHANNERGGRRSGELRPYESSISETRRESHHSHSRNRSKLSEEESHHSHIRTRSKLSEEERAARLREMQQDAEIHEEQRWRRLKKAAEDDAREAKEAAVVPSSRNFLDAAQKRMYGAEKGGSSTIEESIRRRTYYSQGRSEVEGNAFRR